MNDVLLFSFSICGIPLLGIVGTILYYHMSPPMKYSQRWCRQQERLKEKHPELFSGPKGKPNLRLIKRQ